ncbi:YtxH domain-containing protein (plasmid) [Klebsiella sp. WOUb02]|uniref:YtxH domain-containing protein n=1 Tax=Klebsiella sp. WOUb02 TaxID=3161071 RepID=UPI003CEAA509
MASATSPYFYAYRLPNGQVAYAPYPVTAQNAPYRQENGPTHFVTGVVTGVALTYLLTNRQVQQGLSATAKKAWGTVRGEVEELKERLADLQAELDYYRQQEQDSQ